VEYKIQDTGFSVPSLTIQPLVENAIRHGVRIREDGRVEVRTRAAEAFHEITITDNGIGFDLQSAERASGDHIGLKNVQERVAAQCGGSMEIVSQIGSGTTITIRIPK
jgi:sensor histidine kinase YesM